MITYLHFIIIMNMKAKYKDQTVKVVKLVLAYNTYVSKPILVQVKVEYKKDGQIVSDYADANEIEFI